MISPVVFFKDPGCWSEHLLLLGTVALPTANHARHCLSKLKAKVVAHFEVVSKMNKVGRNLNIASQHSINFYLTNQQKWWPVHGLYSCG